MSIKRSPVLQREAERQIYQEARHTHLLKHARRACTWDNEMESTSWPVEVFSLKHFYLASRCIKRQRWFDLAGAALKITAVVYYFVVNHVTHQMYKDTKLQKSLKRNVTSQKPALFSNTTSST